MFDANRTFTIGLRTASGKTDVTVRWPTDEEWGAHRRQRRIVQRQLGRGATESEMDTGDADAKLYEVIKLNGAPPLSAAEASRVVETIGLCDVMDVRLNAEDADVDMQTSQGRVKHTVRIPTIDQVRAMQRTTKYVTLPHNRTEVRTNLESPAALWDKCAGQAEGYDGPVPSLHKDAAIRAVIMEIDREAAPQYDESSF